MTANRAVLVALAAAVSAACSSGPQPMPESKPQPPPPAQVESRPVSGPVDDGFRVDYRPQAEGRTLVEVVEPAGAEVQAWDAGTQIARDKAPLSFDAVGDKWYRVEVRLPSGGLREKKVAARAGHVASVRLTVAQDQGPQPMDRGQFKALLQQLDQTAGDAGKLALLKTALAYNWLSSAMAAVLIDHMVYRQSKLDAVPLIRDRILDKQNAYRMLDHFTYREDKEKVQQLLSQ
jgi:hypothetical protein